MNLQLRTSPRVDTIRPIRDYIAENHIQDPIIFSNDLQTLDKLRNQAIAVSTPSHDGISTLLSYAAQLSWLVGKFPVDIGIRFTWTGSPVGYHEAVTSSQNSLRFELFNILYNLAALYYGAALDVNKNSNEGLKMACNYFSLAAGIFLHMRTSTLPDLRSQPPPDLDESILETYQYFMLARAQESVWQKAVRDGLKDATVAKIAAEVIDRYAKTGEACNRCRRVDRSLKYHVAAKQHQFEASSRYRMSLAALDSKRYGEEVAWLSTGVGSIGLALKNSSYLDPDFVADLTAAQKKMQADLKQAERDNDLIYLEQVPSPSELAAIPRVSMASAKVPPELAEPGSHFDGDATSGTFLFADLIPYAVSMAANMYSEMKMKTVDRLVGQFQELSQAAHDQLSAMNLPGFLEAIEKPLGLPPSIQAHADEIRQSDGIAQLKREIVNTETVKAKCIVSFDTSIQQLEAEKAEDGYARTQLGTSRWRRPISQEASPSLYKQAQDFRQFLATAENSDRVILEKLRQQEPILKLLAGSDYELSEFIPNSRVVDLPIEVSNAAVQLRRQLRELNWLESEREGRIETLRTRAKKDEIKPLLVAEARRLCQRDRMKRVEVIHFDSILQECLEKYESDQEIIEFERKRQEEVLAQIRKTNEKFTKAREAANQEAGGGINSRREQAIQTLEEAYFKYRELVSNVSDARKFYNDLLCALALFSDECCDFVNKRRDEALEMEKDIVEGAAGGDGDDDDDDPDGGDDDEDYGETASEDEGEDDGHDDRYEIPNEFESDMAASVAPFGHTKQPAKTAAARSGVPKPAVVKGEGLPLRSPPLRSTPMQLPLPSQQRQQQQQQQQQQQSVSTPKSGSKSRTVPKNQAWTPGMEIKFL